MTGGNGENAANYQSPEFDRLFEQMKYLDNGPQKQALIDQMIAITQRDAPWSFGYFPKSAAAFHQWVYNGKPTQIVRNHIGYLRIDPKLRGDLIKQWNRPVWWPMALLLLAALAIVYAGWRAWRRRELETAARTLATVEGSK